jgi:hypothetical protein
VKAKEIEREYIPSQGNIYSESLHKVRRRDEAYTCQNCAGPSEVSISDLSAASRITFDKEVEMDLKIVMGFDRKYADTYNDHEDSRRVALRILETIKLVVSS